MGKKKVSKGPFKVGAMKKGDIFKRQDTLLRCIKLTKSKKSMLCEVVCCNIPVAVRSDELHILRDEHGKPLS